MGKTINKFTGSYYFLSNGRIRILTRNYKIWYNKKAEIMFSMQDRYAPLSCVWRFCFY